MASNAWKKVFTDENEPYYYNSVTMETSWDPPPGWAEEEEALPPNWEKHLTDEGEPFYYNTLTQETSWDPPPQPVQHPPVQRGPAVGHPGMPAHSPAIGPPGGMGGPAVGRPGGMGGPAVGRPGGMGGAPAIGRPGMGAPGMGGAPAIGRPGMGAPGMGGAPAVGRPGMGGPPVGRPGGGAPMGRPPGAVTLPSMSDRWFHGNIGRPAAEAHVVRKPIGTYLIRNSSHANAYVITYIGSRNQIEHLLISSNPQGFKIEADNSDNLFHPSMQQLLSKHTEMFKYPVTR